MKTLAIGISGQLGSGKDTLGEALIPVARENGFDILRVAFGDSLKEELAQFLTRYSYPEILDFLNEHCESDEQFYTILAETFEAPPRGPWQKFCAFFGASFVWDYRPFDAALIEAQMHDRSTKERYRELMKWWAHEYRREQFDQLYWIRQVEEKINKVLAERKQTTRPILFYFSDIRYPSEVQCVQERLGGYIIRIIRPGYEPATNHPGEHALDGYQGFNMTVINNKTLADLQYIGKTAFLNACSWKWGNAGDAA